MADRRLRVYISGPLSGPEMAKNVSMAVTVMVDLIGKGYAPFCPHLTYYVEAEHGQIFDHATWMYVDFPWVAVADAVFRIPGASQGAQKECDHARRLGIPVVHSLDELKEVEHRAMLAQELASRDASPQPAGGDPKYLALLDELRSLHLKKAADYGSDADPLANLRGTQLFGVAPWMGAVIRLNDKMQRLKAFCTRGTLANEGVRDTLLDAAAYSLLALRLLEEERGDANG